MVALAHLSCMARHLATAHRPSSDHRHPSRRHPSRRLLDRGASAVEYGLLIAGIAALIALSVYFFGGSVLGLFSSTCDKMTSARSSGSCG